MPNKNKKKTQARKQTSSQPAPGSLQKRTEGKPVGCRRKSATSAPIRHRGDAEDMMDGGLVTPSEALDPENIRGALQDADMEEDGQITLDALGLMEVAGEVYYRPSSSSPLKLVLNRLPTSIQTGTIRYLRGPQRPLHFVTLEGRSDGMRLIGDLYDPKVWELAGDGGVTIPSGAGFKTYLDYRISKDGIQVKTSTKDEVMWHGTYRDASNRMMLQEKVQFPKAAEECPYHDRGIVDGDKQIVSLLGKLYRTTSVGSKGKQLPPDHSIQVWLVWLLGCLFKPAFKDAYPHLVVVGDKECGKTTVADEMAARFGLEKRGSSNHLSTLYRTVKTFSNTNLPVIIDEIQRLPRCHWPTLVNTLNLAYNLNYSTHGDNKKHYVLGAPAMMLGQDWPYEDVALNAKLVILNLNGAAKDPRALEQLRNTRGTAPLLAWARFACDYADRHDLIKQASEESDWLRSSLGKAEYDQTDEIDRTIFNYSTLLVVAAAAKEFGFDLDLGAIRRHVKAMLRDHLSGGEVNLKRRTVAEQFLGDLVDVLQSNSGRGSLIHDVVGDELVFNLANAMDVLRSKSRTYDVATPKAMARQLLRIGAKMDRRRINSVRKRACVVPLGVLKKMDLDVSGLQRDEGKPGERTAA